MSHHRISQRRACRLVKQHRSNQHYRSVKDPRDDLRRRMREIAQVRVRYGYRRIHVLLRREGWRLGRNQAYRVYREERLQLRSKLPKRRKMMVLRRDRIRPRRPDEAWSMDFVSDQLADGRKFRALTVVDVFTREALAIEVGPRLRGEHVVARLTESRRNVASRITCSSTTAANSQDGCSICGPTTTRCASTSVDPASRPITATWRPVMDHYGTNVSTSTGSRRSKRRARSSRRGAATTMRAGLTWLSKKPFQAISPGGRATWPTCRTSEAPKTSVPFGPIIPSTSARSWSACLIGRTLWCRRKVRLRSRTASR